MDNPAGKLSEFVKYVRNHLKGDEKGEAQIFCEHLMQAFGHAGIKEAGGTLEHRVKRGKGQGTGFVDLLWPPRLLMEMKKRGERLDRHYRQAFEYWLHLVPNRPQYVVLCNFDEFWVYDLNQQTDDPMDKLALDDLPTRYTVLNFLFPTPKEPQFNNNLVAVTRVAAAQVSAAFNLIMRRRKKDVPVDAWRAKAQRFILQCVVAMFAEDFNLLPTGIFTALLDDCLRNASSFDLIGGLFRQMNTRTRAEGGRYKEVDYFNGGLFAEIDPIEMTDAELANLRSAAGEDWSKVKPAIFGTLFETSMGEEERHAFGAHFTSEADIQKVVLPTIVRPWRERIAAAADGDALIALHRELTEYRVLDPACGSGNFLYVAYRELKRIEMELLETVAAKIKKPTRQQAEALGRRVSPRQFFGIDLKSFAVELAKVTVVLAKELALREWAERMEAGERGLFSAEEHPLPLDNLDANIRCDDALFCDWPKVDAIIGNPPFQSKNKIQQEMDPTYVRKVRAQFPGVPGRADYCVYWFRRAHDELRSGQRAGLVGTNTIRQNYSREGGLDHIVEHGGTITDAVSSQVWSGDAAVHVSIVNWTKGEDAGPKVLEIQIGDKLDSPRQRHTLDRINSALSSGTDVAAADRLQTNIASEACYQGQTHGHAGFLLSIEDAAEMMAVGPKNREVTFPFLTADEMIGSIGSQPSRFVIDFGTRDVLAARAFAATFAHVEKHVLPTRQQAAADEEVRNAGILAGSPKAKVNLHHRNFLNRWWLLSYAREGLLAKLRPIPRFVSCGRVTKRPIFEFISTGIRPNDALMVFPLPDDYSFGILQSGIHWAWFVARCSTLKGDFRYTSDTVFDTFAWPQDPTVKQIQAVAAAAVELRKLRRKVMADNGWSLRDLYRTLETPGKNPLRDAHAELDAAARAAYGMGKKDDVLAFLLALNQTVSRREAAGEPVTPPGLPACIADPAPFITEDCVQMPK